MLHGASLAFSPSAHKAGSQPAVESMLGEFVDHAEYGLFFEEFVGKLADQAIAVTSHEGSDIELLLRVTNRDLDELAAVDWSGLTHAYGRGVDDGNLSGNIEDSLRLLREDPSRALRDGLWW